jgi:hypothetical protein
MMLILLKYILRPQRVFCEAGPDCPDTVYVSVRLQEVGWSCSVEWDTSCVQVSHFVLVVCGPM